MMVRPTAFLRTSWQATRILVRAGEDDVLKAVLTAPGGSPPHPRSLPTLLESVALWFQSPVHAVLSAGEPECWSRHGLVDGLHLGVDTAHYTVELREPDRDRRRGRRIDGLGSFVDVRQLALRGVR